MQQLFSVNFYAETFTKVLEALQKLSVLIESFQV